MRNRTLALLILVFGIGALQAQETEKIDNLYYLLNPENKTAAVAPSSEDTGYSFDNLSIPEYVDYASTGQESTRYTVTSIGDEAFRNCVSLTSVIIPASVTYIGHYAFNGCTNLTSITFLSRYKLPELGLEAFDNTNNCPIYILCSWRIQPPDLSRFPYPVSTYPLPYKLKLTVNRRDVGWVDYCVQEPLDDNIVVIDANISDHAYVFTKWSDGNTDNPRTLTLTQDTTLEAIYDYIQTGECGKDNKLTWFLDTVSLALSITGAGMLTDNFTYGRFIHSLTIGNKITQIGEGAFYKCSKLENVILGSSVEEVQEGAFSNCSAVRTFTCYSQRPPTLYEYSFYGVENSAIVYVPADYISSYQAHELWSTYDLRPIGATSAETNGAKVTASETSADVVWPAVDNAATYELIIRDKEGNIVCTLIFNANGQLTQIAFNAPTRNNATQASGFSFTVTGLEGGTSYDLTIIAKDEQGAVLQSTTQSFTTEGATTALVETNATSTPYKMVHNDQLFILREGKMYTIHGQEVR